MCFYSRQMAKGYADTDKLARSLVSDARKGVFKQVYLLMGDEPFYVDMVCNAVVENALDESERDFNQIICYGADVNADAVITAARRYPMFATRQLVVLKEAQMMSDLEQLGIYCSNPLESTILVICVMGSSVDKRKALYKAAGKTGVVLESTALRDYELPSWISSFYAGKGLQIAPEAAALLAESTGTDLGKIALETDKMLKNLPSGVTNITPEDIENNVGISRTYSVFELTRCLSYKEAGKALKIAAYLGDAPKFALPMATAPLFNYFYKVLRYHALKMQNPAVSQSVVASELGVNPFFLKEYDAALRNYPLKKCMGIIACIKEFDFRGKGGDGEETSQGELLVELVTRILN